MITFLVFLAIMQLVNLYLSIYVLATRGSEGAKVFPNILKSKDQVQIIDLKNPLDEIEL